MTSNAADGIRTHSSRLRALLATNCATVPNQILSYLCGSHSRRTLGTGAVALFRFAVTQDVQHIRVPCVPAGLWPPAPLARDWIKASGRLGMLVDNTSTSPWGTPPSPPGSLNKETKVYLWLTSLVKNSYDDCWGYSQTSRRVSHTRQASIWWWKWVANRIGFEQLQVIE